MSTLSNPTDVARETLRQLATRRIAPTPDNYRVLYYEISGGDPDRDGSPEAALAAVAKEYPRATADLARNADLFGRAVRDRNWNRCATLLVDLAKSSGSAPARPVPPPAAPARPAAPAAGPEGIALWRDMLVKAIESGVVSQLVHAPELLTACEAAAAQVREAVSEAQAKQCAADLKKLWYKLEMRGGDAAEINDGIFNLLRLMLENTSQLVDEDRWLHGQIAVVNEILSGPLSARRLEEAERRLKEVLFKQSGVKHSLNEAKAALKNLIALFVQRLSDLAESTGDYRKKIEGYSEKLSRANEIGEIGQLLDEIVRETRAMTSATQASQEEIERARHEALQAEAKVRALESELEQMSALVQQDQLTGSLNRRGFDDAFVRESSRSDRRATPLCVALLDIDNFKQMNDTLGHQTGDRVLTHLVQVIREALRPNDVIARFGGEEFLILLPDTAVADAIAVISRLQRELTRRLFLHNNDKVLITFSAGVAMRASREDQASLVARADAALYQAKREGKNRVCAAPDKPDGVTLDGDRPEPTLGEIDA